jgi:hypothetical protein
VTNAIPEVSNEVVKTNYVPLWAALIAVAGGLALHFLKTRSDKKAQKKQKLGEVKAWFIEVGHYAERSHTPRDFLKEFQLKLSEAPRINSLAQQEFPSMGDLVKRMTKMLTRYLQFAEIASELDPSGPGSIRDNRTLCTEIIALVEEFTILAKKNLS